MRKRFWYRCCLLFFWLVSELYYFKIISSAINDVSQRGLTFPWFEVHGCKQSQSCCVPGPSKEINAPCLLPVPAILAVVTALSFCLGFTCGTGRICHQPTHVWLGWALTKHCPVLVCSLASARRMPWQVPGALWGPHPGSCWGQQAHQGCAYTQLWLPWSLQTSSWEHHAPGSSAE